MSTLEREVTDLKRRLKRLEKTVAGLVQEDPAPAHTKTSNTRATPLSSLIGVRQELALSNTEQEMSNPQQLLAWMRVEGLIIDPPAEYLAYGERWRALPEAEKRDILWELDHLTPGPMASEIISEGRR